MRGKVLADIVKRQEKEKELQKKDFEMLYGKTKKAEFKYADDPKLIMTDFRAIHKDIFSYNLSKSAFAIYPVLCVQTDFKVDKTFQISQKNISKLAGISENGVRKGIEELENVGLLYRERTTERKRRFYVYNINFIREPELVTNKGKTIYFYTSLIHNGLWAILKPRSKVLYLVMRATAKQDWKAYSFIEGEEYDEDFKGLKYREYIQNRKWDICHLSLSELCRIAKVERTNIKEVMDELEKYGLIEQIGEWTKVYIKPKRFLKYYNHKRNFPY